MEQELRLPDFLIIGAEKAGTTWLHAQLVSHPDIYMPKTKEIHYFNKWDSRLQLRDNYTAQELNWYAEYFKTAEPDQKVGEVTPLYLCDSKAPERIAHTLPQARFIAILRNPVDRAYSHYWMARRREHEIRPFDQVIAAQDAAIIGRGQYGAQIKHWHQSIDERALLILIYEEVFADPDAGLAKVATFLGVLQSGFEQGQDSRVHGARRFRNPAAQNRAIRLARYLRETPGFLFLGNLLKSMGIYDAFRRMNEAEVDYPVMVPKDRKALQAFYAEDMATLEETTGLDLAHWRNGDIKPAMDTD